MAQSPKATHRSLARLYLDRHPDEAVRLLEGAPTQDVASLLDRETSARAAEILRRLTPETGALVLAVASTETISELLTAMNPNRVAALLARLDSENRERILGALPPEAASDLRALMSYPADSAGHLMDPRAVTFRPDGVVRDVVQKLRTLRRRRIQDVFLVDEEGRLVGSVSLQDIVLGAPGDRLDELARRRPLASVQATSSREAVLEELERHRVTSLPVIDFDGRLMGVLRQDELIATAETRVADDLVTMTGAGKDERSLSPPWFAVRKRLPWLEINLLTAFLAASVVGLFEGTIARFTALAVLLPVVAGQSGNTGAQALAVTMRGLALREVRTRQWLRVGGKELLVGAINGVAVAVTTSVAVLIWSRSIGLALVIGVSMVLSMTVAGLAGAVIPMALTAIRQDPAQSSSIILTTVTDVVGFFSFLGIATLLSSWL